jgi:hypothetical protein
MPPGRKRKAATDGIHAEVSSDEDEASDGSLDHPAGRRHCRM